MIISICGIIIRRSLNRGHSIKPGEKTTHNFSSNKGAKTREKKHYLKMKEHREKKLLQNNDDVSSIYLIVIRLKLVENGITQPTRAKKKDQETRR
jgi:hypothetical protein